MSIAPLRAIAEPDTFHLGLGWLQVSGAVAALPALAIWTWGLFVVVTASTRPSGKRLLLVAGGDFALAANFGTFFTVMVLQGVLRDFRAQGGEFVLLSGLGWAALFLLFFVVPFTYSGLWAVRHMRANEPTDSPMSTPATTVSAGGPPANNDAGRPLLTALG